MVFILTENVSAQNLSNLDLLPLIDKFWLSKSNNILYL